VLALVVGILLGAWQPRGELLRLRSELDASRGKDCRSDAAASVRDLLGAGGMHSPDDVPVKRSPTSPTPSDPGEKPAAPENIPPDALEAEAPKNQLPPEEELKEMAAVLDARRAQAIAALSEQADLDEAEIATVEAVYDKMNAQVKASVDEFVARAEASGTVERRDMMALGADVLDAAVVAEDGVRSVLPPDVAADLPEEYTDPLAFISSDVVMSLSRIRDLELPRP
ncbi:MAG TPA: hypothetical protein PKY30_24380, partial [Myxococcota bacterium]|nr:hypothetical protein [Myxococcota bacterium]